MKLKMMIILLMFVLLNSCLTTYKFGKKFEKKNIEQIIVGHTTKDKVIELFGEPLREGMHNGLIVFTYSYEEVIFDNNDNVKKEGNTLVIEFDQNNVVKNYYLNIPGPEPVILGYMIFKREKEKEQQAAAQQNMAMQQQMMMNTPPARF